MAQHAVPIMSSYQEEQTFRLIYKCHVMISAVLVLLIAGGTVTGVCGSRLHGHKDSTATNEDNSTKPPIDMATPLPDSKKYHAFETTKELYDAVNIYIEHRKANSIKDSETSFISFKHVLQMCTKKV